MDLQQLKTFIVLAQCENMPAAAEVLETSQPQISRHLTALENELGNKLFDRVGRGIQLNEEGKLFLRYASDALSSLADGELALRQSKNSRLGTIVIGTTAFAAILTPTVRAYARKNPQVHFHYIAPVPGNRGAIKNAEILLSPIAQGQYNFKSYFPVYRTYLQEDYYIICSPRLAPFPKEKKALSFEDYCSFPFIVSSVPLSGMLHTDYSILEAISDVLGCAPLRISFQTNDFILKMQMVADCLGMSVIPECCLPFARRIVPGLRVFRIDEFQSTRMIIVARKRLNAMSPVAVDFWNFLLESRHMEPDNAK